MTFTLTDICDPPTSITVPNPVIAAYTYNIRDETKTYSHSEFTIEPALCTFDYSYTVDNLLSNGGTAVDSLPTAPSLAFGFVYDGPSSCIDDTQAITVTATSKSKYTATQARTVEAQSFNLVIAEPSVCQNAYLTASTDTANPAADAFSGTAAGTTVTAYDVIPLTCTITYACTGVAALDG